MTPLTHTDNALARLRDGDLDAIESLVGAFTPAIYAHALRLFGDAQTASDIAQRVWAGVAPSLPAAEDAASVGTMLFAATREACLDAVREGRRRPVPADPFASVAAPADVRDIAAVSAAVERAIGHLAPEDRDAYSAITLFGLTYAQAAPVLGVPAATVRSRAFRARRSLALSLSAPKEGR